MGGRRSIAPGSNGYPELNGSYLLKAPYSDDRELLGDIMRFGADVQVLEPKEQRAEVLLEEVKKYIGTA